MRIALPIAMIMAFCLVGCSGKKKAAIPKTPSAASKQVVKGIISNKPQVAWQALPASYQKDVNGLIKDFSAKMDPEVYDQGFVLIKKLNEILETKKEYILSHPMLAKNVDKAEAGKNWDAVTKLFSTILKSDISKVDSLKTLDVEEFLSTTGTSLMKQADRIAKLAPKDKQKSNDFKAELKKIKFTTLGAKGDSAKLKVEIPGKPDETEEFVRVEGKWIPKEMADDWKKQIGEAKKSIAKMETQIKDKKKIMAQMKMFEGKLDQFLATDSAEEFNKVFGETFGAMMGMMMGGMSGPSKMSPMSK